MCKKFKENNMWKIIILSICPYQTNKFLTHLQKHVLDRTTKVTHVLWKLFCAHALNKTKHNDASSTCVLHRGGGVFCSHGLLTQRGEKGQAFSNTQSPWPHMYTLHGWAQFHHKAQGHYHTKTCFLNPINKIKKGKTPGKGTREEHL